MTVFQYDDKGDPNIGKNLRALGVGSNLTVEHRVQIL